MADAAAKREARRRKILENSEYRLQRITGQANHHEPSGERNKKPVGNEASSPCEASCPAANGVLPSEAIIESQSLDSLINELNADINVEESTTQPHYSVEHDIFTLLSSPNVPYRRNAAARANMSSENGNASNRARMSPERRDSLNDLLPDNGDDQNANAKTDPSLMNSLLSSRLIYVALAIVVNIMVILKLEHLFGMSIVIPFFVIMIGRLSVCTNEEVSKGSNMLVAALILSNVRPDLVKVIHRLKGSFSMSGKILQDFAVYMFTFVLVHTALHRYWNDLGYAPAFPEQEIIDDGI